MHRLGTFPTLLAIGLAAAAFACSGSESSNDESDNAGALTNAKIPTAAAEREAVAPVVSFAGKCTATKVGPRHFLTAAHCVMSRGLLPQPGTETAFEQSNYRENGEVIKRRERQRWPYMEKVIVDEKWARACFDAQYRSGCNDVAFTKEALAPDIALIVVKDEAPSSARVEREPLGSRLAELARERAALRASDDVTLAGYGCTNSADDPAHSMLKVYEVRVGDTKILDALAGPKAVADDFRLLEDHYVFSDAKVAICPGDSGGPALIKRPGGGFAVAGIHAGYTFDGANKVIANWHTRVDSAASIQPKGGTATNVIDWLEREGVEIAR